MDMGCPLGPGGGKGQDPLSQCNLEKRGRGLPLRHPACPPTSQGPPSAATRKTQAVFALGKASPGHWLPSPPAPAVDTRT